MNPNTLRLALQPRALLSRLRADPIVRNSTIYIAGSALVGFLGYVFHFETGHLLGPSAYAIVASAIAALYVITLPVIGLQLVTARFVSVAAARNQRGAIFPMITRLTAFSLLAGLPVAGLIVLFSGQVASFLKLPDQRTVYFLAFAGLAAVAATVNRGALQGMSRFVALSANALVEMISRLVLAGGFIIAGFGALGAVASVALAPVLAYAQSLVMLRPTDSSITAAERVGGLPAYAFLATAASIGINFLFGIDTLLAKHFLSPTDAGVYAASAVLARVVYFLGLSVAGVMFPEVARLHARNEAHFHVVDLALVLIGGMGVALTLTYFLVPGLVLLPYGPGFSAAERYLGVFAVALTLLALANLLISYFLSINRRSFVVPLFGACVVETALISLFHSSIWEILAMVVITLGLLAAVMAAAYINDRLMARRGVG